ncbi:MAG: DNA integrity scanning protein DisA nucleotide-binding domain protein [Bryobacteraceae bacterium]
MSWREPVDFAVLAAAIYILLRCSVRARALRLVMGTIGVYALALLARQAHLIVTVWVLDGASVVLVFVLLVSFQAELRHGLMQIDGSIRGRPAESDCDCVSEVPEAAFDLARSGSGALIVLVRRDPVAELTNGGVAFGGLASAELLETIFQKWSPLHDGAAIIDGRLLERAGVVLPLAQHADLPRSYGTRHRAAVGLAERCDAVVVAVSEERGDVTVMTGQARAVARDRADLEYQLASLLSSRRETWTHRLGAFFTSGWKLKAAALAMAAVTWSALAFLEGPPFR